MCGAWSQEEWLQTIRGEGELAHDFYKGDYTLEGTFYNAKGERAIITRNIYGSTFLTNVYSEDGWDYNTFSKPRDARKQMQERGFTRSENPLPRSTYEQQIDEAIALNEATAIDGLVDGKTLAQWFEQSRINEDLPENEHVHPLMRYHSTQLEQDCAMASMTITEMLEMLVTTLPSSMGRSPLPDLSGLLEELD